MTADEIELYRSTLSDHAGRPRNFREMPDATARAEGHNPACGDKVTIWVKIENNIIVDASFNGSGCSIFMGSASMLTDAVKGQPTADARALFDRFHGLLTAPADAEVDLESLGKLAAFQEVRKYPIRVKCATLPWHAFHRAMDSST